MGGPAAGHGDVTFVGEAGGNGAGVARESV
jgi:hypothetical protein